VTLAVVVERRYLEQAQPAGLIGALRDRGVAVRVIDTDHRAVRVDDAAWLAQVELVVVRGRSTAALFAAACAEAAGLPTLNSHTATEGVRNKATMAVALAAAGVPGPATLVGSPAALAAEIAPDEYPVVLKPVFGDNGHGLRLVGGRRELRDVRWPEPVGQAQRDLPADGHDLKLYVIGQRVFAVRKPSSFRPARRQGGSELGGAAPVAVTLAMRELALRCGRVFGLELFGVDCIERPGGPWVIEVNEFPNYTGVGRADELLADYVLAKIPRSRAGDPQPTGERRWTRR
jgi:ribosomal protein S6--L-glutamate ligase